MATKPDEKMEPIEPIEHILLNDMIILDGLNPKEIIPTDHAKLKSFCIAYGYGGRIDGTIKNYYNVKGEVKKRIFQKLMEVYKIKNKISGSPERVFDIPEVTIEEIPEELRDERKKRRR